jgi:hypothetical protein
MQPGVSRLGFWPSSTINGGIAPMSGWHIEFSSTTLHPVSRTSSLLQVAPSLGSASVLSPSWFFHLWLLRSHRSPRFPRSARSPLSKAQATLMPDAASVRKQAPPKVVGTCSCQPVPRGLPSSIKQLHTLGPPRPFALVAHCRPRIGPDIHCCNY